MIKYKVVRDLTNQEKEHAVSDIKRMILSIDLLGIPMDVFLMKELPVAQNQESFHFLKYLLIQ